MPLEKLQNYSYEEYLAHQIEKTSSSKVRNHYKRKSLGRQSIFKTRFEYAIQYGFIKQGWKALCLGARLGEEVRALKELGVDAIGIDLVPCPPDVIEGDFQHLEYPDQSFDIVYSNSIDHSFDMEKLFSEAYRVIKHKGFLILDIFPGDNNVSDYEVYKLDVVDIIHTFCTKFNFELVSVNSKLKRMYKFKHHKETQVILRKGTND